MTGKPVERRAVAAGETFEPVERAGRIEGGRVQRQRVRRAVAAGAGAGVLLEGARMWRAVGAEEEPRVAAGGGGDERLAMRLPLEHRQAVPVRAQAAGEDGVAVVEQVLRRDGRRKRAVGRGRLADVVGGLAGGDVLEDDPQPGHAAAQRLEDPVDEDRLAVEHVDLLIDHLAVHQQRQPDPLHRLQYRIDPLDRADAGVRVRGGAGRIELDAVDDAARLRRLDFRDRGRFGEVQSHQRLEAAVGRRSQARRQCASASRIRWR